MLITENGAADFNLSLKDAYGYKAIFIGDEKNLWENV